MLERRDIAYQLASLALSWVSNNERLTVREREGLRRSISAIADLQGWTPHGQSPMETASKEVLKLTRAGTRALVKDLEDELAEKKREITQLRRAGKALSDLAEKGDFSDPIEFSYMHTARSPSYGLVTKTQELVLTEAAEAEKAAGTIETKTETWTKLQKEMIEVLKGRGRQLEDMKADLPAFVATSESLMEHVLATRL
ncbi:MAG: hypothetical protein OEU54_13270 [Gemmatimonadota bacterium]|nr:hypothetical protein [Gemmatimonadota bacterium]